MHALSHVAEDNKQEGDHAHSLLVKQIHTVVLFPRTDHVTPKNAPEYGPSGVHGVLAVRHVGKAEKPQERERASVKILDGNAKVELDRRKTAQRFHPVLGHGTIGGRGQPAVLSVAEEVRKDRVNVSTALLDNPAA